MNLAAGRGGRGVAALLRGILLAIAFAFAIGFGIGTWIRCQMEQPIGYLASRSAAPPLPLDVGLATPVVGDTSEHKE